MRWKSVVGTLAFAALLFSCAGGQKVQKTEQLLAAAGFRQKIATTPEQHEHLHTLQQRAIVAHPRDDGEIGYVYADEEGCNCIWVGQAEDYQRFQHLAIQAQIAEDQRRAAEAQAQAAMNWGVWGPWWW